MEGVPLHGKWLVASHHKGPEQVNRDTFEVDSINHESDLFQQLKILVIRTPPEKTYDPTTPAFQYRRGNRLGRYYRSTWTLAKGASQNKSLLKSYLRFVLLLSINTGFGSRVKKLGSRGDHMYHEGSQLAVETMTTLNVSVFKVCQFK